MVEILGHDLIRYFLEDDREDAELTYRDDNYEVWQINDALLGYMEDQSEEEFKAQAGEDAWWEYADYHFALPNATIVIHGCYLNAYNIGDTKWRTDYNSLTDYIQSHVGGTSPRTICTVAASLAEDNDMTMAELFKRCQGQ